VSEGWVLIPGPGLSSAAVEGPDLLQRFTAVSDGRSDQGRDHPVAVVLTLYAAAAVLAGMRSFTAIAGWIADVPTELLSQLYARADATSRTRRRGPSKSTLWRVVTGADATTVDAVIGAWLAEYAQLTTPPTPASADDHASVDDPAPADESAPDDESVLADVPADDQAPVLAIAVDGKTVRGAIDTEGHQTHLLAAATHGQQLVLGQIEVGAKTTPITHREVDRGHAPGHHPHHPSPTRPTGSAVPARNQVWLIERHTRDPTGKLLSGIAALGVTSLPDHHATPRDVAGFVRNHWGIESLY